MERKFLVTQPPLSEKYRLLVDDITEKRNLGITTDVDKIEYNLNLLGESFKKDLEIQKLLTNKGLTTVIPIGCFVTVLQLNKDNNTGTMVFFDFDAGVDTERIKTLLKPIFSKSVINEFFKIQESMLSEFDEEDDLFDLILPNLS